MVKASSPVLFAFQRFYLLNRFLSHLAPRKPSMSHWATRESFTRFEIMLPALWEQNTSGDMMAYLAFYLNLEMLSSKPLHFSETQQFKNGWFSKRLERSLETSVSQPPQAPNISFCQWGRRHKGTRPENTHSSLPRCAVCHAKLCPTLCKKMSRWFTKLSGGPMSPASRGSAFPAQPGAPSLCTLARCCRVAARLPRLSPPGVENQMKLKRQGGAGWILLTVETRGPAPGRSPRPSQLLGRLHLSPWSLDERPPAASAQASVPPHLHFPSHTDPAASSAASSPPLLI